MLHRMLPVVSVLALVGCQPYYTYAPGPYPQYYGYYPGRPTLSAGVAPAAVGGETNQFLLNASRAGLPAGVAVTPASLAGGSFHEIDATASEVTFANQDPVRKRELAADAGRHVEWLTLKNGGVFVYERAAAGETAAASDAELLRGDLETPAFRQRGIAFDPARLERMGPFIFLAQSSPAYNCVVFRGKVRATGITPAALETSAADAQAYGNVCYVKQARDLAAVRTEMAAILSQARFLRPTLTAVAGTSAAPTPIALAAKMPEATTRPGGGALTPVEACHALVSFSATPALKDVPAGEAVRSVEYRVENGAYSEEAVCTCRTNFSYTALSQFDAVDNARAGLEKGGFTLEKASFDETAELGKELDYEASAPNPGGTFLVGRNFYQQCGLTVKATGTSYADLVKARKFLASVAKAAAPEKSALGAPTVISPAVITAAKSAAENAPAASPRVPVSEAALAGSAKPTPPVAAPQATGEAAASQDATAMRLRRLNDLLEQKLISPGEYDAKRKSILDTL